MINRLKSIISGDIIDGLIWKNLGGAYKDSKRIKRIISNWIYKNIIREFEREVNRLVVLKESGWSFSEYTKERDKFKARITDIPTKKWSYTKWRGLSSYLIYNGLYSLAYIFLFFDFSPINLTSFSVNPRSSHTASASSS